MNNFKSSCCALPRLYETHITIVTDIAEGQDTAVVIFGVLDGERRWIE